jgi:GT2 family glycosyltransferase
VKKTVFIIILNWNNHVDTIECIKSCLELTYQFKEIIVVDNASSDNSVNIISTKFPQIKILISQENLGYSGGNNLGIRWALGKQAEYIWILNNDVIVEKSSLTHLLQAYTDNERYNIGILGSKILDYSNQEYIDFVGGKFNLQTGFTSHIGRHERDLGQYDEFLISSDFITGASMLFKAQLIKEIGSFDESFFLYCEDVDFCVRAKKKGYNLFVTPNSVVFHKCSNSTKLIKGSAAFYITRNTLFLLEKYHLSILNWILKIFMTDFKRCISYLKQKNLRACYNVCKGYIYWSAGYAGSLHAPYKVRKFLFIWGKD